MTSKIGQISSDGTCQNRRKSDVFKEPNGSIHYNGAFSKRPISRYNFDTKEWTDNKNPICWHGRFVGNLGLVKKNYGRNILKLFINIELIQVK